VTELTVNESARRGSEREMKRSVKRCYRNQEWTTVQLPPEAAPGLEVAAHRTRSLVHDMAGHPIEDMLVAAYLQGVIDGTQVALKSDGERP
jgi:hypothetical protein